MTIQGTIEQIVLGSRFTVLLGKNGAGKSSLMREMDSAGRLNTRYISPERGGTLKYDPNVDNNIANSQGWLEQTRRQNRFEQFRQQSAVQFKTLEVLVLREIEKDKTKRNDHGYTFDLIIEELNKLLPAVKLVRSDRGFSINSKTGAVIQEDQISSGESELLALTIEVLVFSRSEKPDKVLLLDEPDVHLHPDLQQKFISFVESVASKNNVRVVIATHSTAVIGAFSPIADLTIVPVSNREQRTFTSFKRSNVCDEILPVFGAHPLSNVFNLSPVILVEGEDDKRVLDQVVRSSNGRFKLSPSVVGTVSDMADWENWLNTFLPVLYDTPKGFSLRDLDSSPEADISDVGVVCRVRLNCYAIENLLLTNECLLEHGLAADELKGELQKWRDQYPKHKFVDEMNVLINEFESRRTLKIKNLRNIIVAILGSNKPWEVVVGQTIVKYVDGADSDTHSIATYLGDKAKNALFS